MKIKKDFKPQIQSKTLNKSNQKNVMRLNDLKPNQKNPKNPLKDDPEISAKK